MNSNKATKTRGNRLLKAVVVIILTICFSTDIFAGKTVDVSAIHGGAFPFGQLFDGHIVEYSELTDKNEKMAWAIYYIYEKFMYDDTPLEWIEDMNLSTGDMTQEFWNDWGQYLVAFRLLDDMVDGTEKEAMLKWAKGKGYWKEDYVAPYDKFDMTALKSTYYIYAWCDYAARLTDLAADDITEKIFPGRKFSDYDFFYFASIEKGIFSLDYTPSTIKWSKNKPSYPFLYSDNGNYVIYYSNKLNKWVGFGYTDEVTQNILTEQNTSWEPHGMACGIWTEEQYNFVKNMDYNALCMFTILCKDTDASYAWAKENWNTLIKEPYYKTTILFLETREGWQYGKDAPEYILEFLAETDNPYLKESKYKSWYENWLKQYKGTAGNYTLLTEYYRGCEDYGKDSYATWYAKWLKEHKPDVTMDGKKVIPTATPTPTPIPIDHTSDVDVPTEDISHVITEVPVSDITPEEPIPTEVIEELPISPTETLQITDEPERTDTELFAQSDEADNLLTNTPLPTEVPISDQQVNEAEVASRDSHSQTVEGASNNILEQEDTSMQSVSLSDIPLWIYVLVVLLLMAVVTTVILAGKKHNE